MLLPYSKLLVLAHLWPININLHIPLIPTNKDKAFIKKLQIAINENS